MSDEGLTQSINNLRVATLLHFSGSILDKLARQVFLYDPNWMPSNTPDDVDTLPFVYLEVVKEEVVQTNAVSKKRLILFESEAALAANATGFRPSVVHVVADNIVNEPVIHKLECLLPADALAKMFSTTATDIRNVAEFISTHQGASFGVNTGSSGAAADAAGIITLFEIVRAIFTGLSAATALVKKTLDLLRTFSGKSTDYNRRSLMSMSRRRTIIKYKHWASWELKNVAIVGLSISKVGTEDDYFRASVELQEMPILYIAPFNPIGKAKEPTGLFVAASKVVKSAFEALIGIAEKSGGG